MQDCGRKQDMLFDERGSALGTKTGFRPWGLQGGTESYRVNVAHLLSGSLYDRFWGGGILK